MGSNCPRSHSHERRAECLCNIQLGFPGLTGFPAKPRGKSRMSGLLYLQPPCRGLAVVLEKRAGAGGVGPEDKREMQGENRRSNFALFLEGCPGLFLLPTGFLGGGVLLFSSC